MAPRKGHFTTTVFAAQVKSSDEKSILIETGGFTPVRWFLEHALHPDVVEEERPKKRRKIEPSPRTSADTGVNDAEELVPLVDVAIDFHFPESRQVKPVSKDVYLDNVELKGSSEVDVMSYGIETDDTGTRFRFSLPAPRKPVLLLECAPIGKETLDILCSIANPIEVMARAANQRSKDYPATVASWTLHRVIGQTHDFVRLRASLSWRSGISAFLAGAPVGRAKLYPDYESLLRAYEDQARATVDHTQPWTPQDFYESVHAPSKDRVMDGMYDGILESELYPFQKRALSWMLEREGAGTSSNRPNLSFYEPVTDINGERCYVNHLQGIISRDPPEDVDRLSGGLLAEEMGLGKTVELMALISLNLRSKLHDPMLVDNTGTRLQRSKATLIITPNSILQQWQSELQRHAPHLSVYYYEGVSSGKKRNANESNLVNELATCYDVVLTTYHILSREVHFAEDPPDREMRGPRMFERKRSPLVQLEWWRICLDEAQMVESGVTAAARVACRLPRVHSWAVTGTPLRKDVQDLHGLMIFLRYKPFSENSKLWGHLVTNHRHQFRRVFGQIALRHTKELIRDELRLPPQKRVVVNMPFSAVEQQNYSTLFNQMCEDVRLDATGAPAHSDWNPNDPKTLEAMRSWLVRLRQTCLHPQVGGRNRRALGRGTAPLRTVAEVLEVMIEQNETNLRVEERAAVSSSLARAHILGNNGEDDRRSQKALAIYESAMKTTTRMVQDAREQLARAKEEQAAKGDTAVESEDEDSSSESTPAMGRAKNQLRAALDLHHACTFFAATAYYQIKTNEALTQEGSDQFKQLEEKESALYERAKALRREILRDTARKAESLMRRIKDLDKRDTYTKLPRITDLRDVGGIESRRIVDKAAALFDVLREQVATIKDWRAKMAAFLVKPLVDEENEGIEMTGDEYEDSTKQQDELYVYFDALKAVQADLNTFVTGESAPLIDHEVKYNTKLARRVLDPETPDDQKPQGVHSPQLALKLYAVRNEFRDRVDEVGSIRSLMQEARTLESAMEFSSSGVRAAERAFAQQHLASLQSVFKDYNKALSALEKEVDLFRNAQNRRVEFYRQLQEVSDAVAPYKDELDPALDQHALGGAMHKEEQASNALAQLRTKNRFLLHLRDESGAQAGPKICIICTSPFERGVLTVCGHQFCKDCITHWFQQARNCPVCKRKLSGHDIHDITYRPQELRAQEEVQSAEPSSSSRDRGPTAPSQASIYTDVDPALMDEVKSIDLPSSYGTKIDTIARHLHWLRDHDAGAKSIIFSQYREFLDVLGGALQDFRLHPTRLGRPGAVEKFRQDPSVDCLLLDAKTDSSGLTLVAATHVLVCEPLVQTAVELQAIARVHRIGQTRPTTVWMYLIRDTVEEAIYELSVARRQAHVQARKKTAAEEGENGSAIEAAESEELQAAPLSRLLAAGKGGGELVGNEDLWRCLFGKAREGVAREGVEREVGRYWRGEAAEGRRSKGGQTGAGAEG